MSTPAAKDSSAIPVGAQFVLRPLANPLSLSEEAGIRERL